jgi:hypothetical protein
MVVVGQHIRTSLETQYESNRKEQYKSCSLLVKVMQIGLICTSYPKLLTAYKASIQKTLDFHCIIS